MTTSHHTDAHTPAGESERGRNLANRYHVIDPAFGLVATFAKKLHGYARAMRLARDEGRPHLLFDSMAAVGEVETWHFNARGHNYKTERREAASGGQS